MFAQLVDDPSSHPDKFPTEKAVEAERKRLFQIIEDLVRWENSFNEEVLAQARTEIRASCGNEPPLVYDPFSGGGSIPLEAQRLGLSAFGSDLNPVAVIIGKAMIEIPPKFKSKKPIHPGGEERTHYGNAGGLAEDVKYYGEWMRDKAWERIGHLYPKVDLPSSYGGGQGSVIGWFWARTVPSPDPAFSDLDVPLVSSFLLSSKKGKEVWLEPETDRQSKSIKFNIRRGGTKEELGQAALGTTAGKRQAFRCIMSGAAIPYDYIRKAGKSGKMGLTLLAIGVEGRKGRVYVEPNKQHLDIARSAKPTWAPDVKLPSNPRDFKTPNYGLYTFGDLFTGRQLVALNTFSELVEEARAQIEKDAARASLPEDAVALNDGGLGAKAYAEAVSTYLAFAADRAADAWSAQVGWRHSVEASRSTFARQALPMLWDFVELNPFSASNGNWSDASVKWIYKSLSALCARGNGRVEQGDAQTVELPKSAVVSTDPPYYDNIGYAELSDFFYVWLRRNVHDVYPRLTSTLAVPKAEELVATPYRHGGKEAAEDFFLSGMKLAFSNMAAQSNPEFPTTIYYAFKQSEVGDEGVVSTGWATFIQAVIDSGYEINATWPLRTEKPGRMISVGNNALANSVVLSCRVKGTAAESITRAEFIRALKRELPSAVSELQAANVSPADMPQSAIGPGMGIFSRYHAVLEADDSLMSVKTALQLINAELDEFLNDLHGEFDADTRFAATWFEQNGYNQGEFGSANSIAQARGISVDSVRHAGIVESAASKVRILKRTELGSSWDPVEDDHLTIWECCQHLIRVLENEGEYAAALLIKKIGPDRAELVKDLAYYLYDVCSNKRQDAKEATAYNGLIAVWTDLTRQAAAIHDIDPDRQTSMDI